MRAILPAVLLTVSAAQGGIVLDFEGLADQDDVLEFYNGGTSGSGAMGPDFGVSFVNALALIDSDDGGSGNFANEPSSMTAISPGSAGGTIIVNVPVGFTAFSTWFSTVNEITGFIQIYDGLDGTGNLLVDTGLGSLGSAGAGDPTGDFDTWAFLGFDLKTGVGQSVVFGADSDAIFFDDMGFTLVPAPAALALLGLAGAVTARRRRARPEVRARRPR